MLLTITHLKAPWPVGAVVGDVIDLPSVPPWALGKCAAAPQGDVVTIAQPAAEQDGTFIHEGTKPQADKPIGPENVTLKATDLDRPKRGRPRKDQS